MTLQASLIPGVTSPLCLSEIKTEFSETSSDCLTGFYGVYSTPASGDICISDFLGTSQSFYGVTVGENSAGTILGYYYQSGSTANYGGVTTNTAAGNGAGQTRANFHRLYYTRSTKTFEVKFRVPSAHLLTSSTEYFDHGTGGGISVRNSGGSELWSNTSASSSTWLAYSEGTYEGYEQTITIVHTSPVSQNGGSATASSSNDGAGFAVDDILFFHMIKTSAHIA